MFYGQKGTGGRAAVRRGLNVHNQALVQGESGNEGSIIKQINQDG